MSTELLSQLNGTQDLIGSNLTVVEQVLKNIYSASKQAKPGEIFRTDSQGLIQDIQAKQLR